MSPEPSPNDPDFLPSGFEGAAQRAKNSAQSLDQEISTRLSDFDQSDEENPIDPIDELLVSYLDGELNETERADLEERLIAEDQLRSRLTELQSGWEMLDSLPQTSVNEDFARTTVELVAARESTMLQAQRRIRPWKQIGWLSLVVVGSLACGLAGYAIPVQIKNNEYRERLEMLPLAEHLDAFLADIDLKIIEELANDKTWKESMQLANEAGGISNPASLDLERRELDDRIEVIQKAERDIQVDISTNWDRLNSLNKERLEKVESRAQAIREMQNPSLILSTLDQYSRWWQQLSPGTQDEILKAEDDKKLEVIQREVRKSSRRWVRNFVVMLGEADRVPIQQQLLLIANDRIERGRQLEEAWVSSQGETLNPEEIRWWNIKPEQLLDFVANRPPFAGPPRPQDSQDEGRPDIFRLFFSPLTISELELVEELLSKQALAILYAESDSPTQRREILSTWCMDIIQQASPSMFDSMLNMYRYWDEERRETLDLSQPDRMLNELRGRRWSRRNF